MGGHDMDSIKVPDWRIYRVEDVPELVVVQKRLAAHGLKDPWLRNEVWRYQEYKHRNSGLGRFTKIMGRGFKYGLVLAVITTALEKAFLPHKSHDGH